MSNGIPYVTKYTNAVLSCEVIDVKDVETQMLYIANVVEAKVLSEDKSCTYAYYHAHIKPKKNPAPAQGEGYVCKVCGYFHEGSELTSSAPCASTVLRTSSTSFPSSRRRSRAMYAPSAAISSPARASCPRTTPARSATTDPRTSSPPSSKTGHLRLICKKSCRKAGRFCIFI